MVKSETLSWTLGCGFLVPEEFYSWMKGDRTAQVLRAMIEGHCTGKKMGECI